MTRLRRRLQGEAGFTLVELLVVMTVFGVVIAIAGGTIVQSLRVHREQAERVEQLNRTRVALERITREVRGANPLTTAAPNQIELRTQRANQWRTITVRLATPAGQPARVELRDWPDATPDPGFRPMVLNVDTSEPLFRYFDSVENVNSDPPQPLAGTFDPDDVRVVEVRLGPNTQGAGDIEFRDHTSIRNLRDPGEVTP